MNELCGAEVTVNSVERLLRSTLFAEERAAVFASSGRGALAAHKHSGLR